MLFAGFGSISSDGRTWRGSTSSPGMPEAALRVERMISGMEVDMVSESESVFVFVFIAMFECGRVD
jgi:hypothetical protein